MTFWDTATRAQRLAQIDGGIELGMSATQVAKNCGATRNAVIGFAFREKRHFNATRGDYRQHQFSHEERSAGGKVSGLIQARSKGCLETDIRSAFEIFDTNDNEGSLFDEYPNEMEG